MKVLWVSNVLFPDVCRELGIKESNTGGWMKSTAAHIEDHHPEIQLNIIAFYDCSELIKIKTNKTTYFLIPKKSVTKKSIEKYCKSVICDVKPNFIHLHGSEFSHSLYLMRTAPNYKYLLTLQGLVSEIHKFYYSDISLKEILKNITFRDMIKLDTVFQQKQKIKNRGDNEIKIIKSVQFVTGRSSWDKTHSLKINNELKYYHCDRVLRHSFYQSRKWSFAECEKHTIFLSQATYPIKGLHIVLKALPYVIKKFPNTQLYVAGNNIFKNSSIYDKLKLSGYGKYIISLIKKHKLEGKVFFLGSLNEEDIIKRFLKSNLFICPSSIENSPNSLAEAQLLGIPCISSYVGGAPEMIEEGKTGFLYRFEESAVLASKISDVFSMTYKQLMALSVCEINVASKRHDFKENTQKLIEIYKDVCSTIC